MAKATGTPRRTVRRATGGSLIRLCALALMMIIISACATSRHSGTTPSIPILEDSWSPPRTESRGGGTEIFQCLTVEDKDRLYDYIYLLEEK